MLALSCSSDASERDAGELAVDAGSDEGDDAPIVPRDLSVSALPGGNGVLELIALTLRTGPRGSELYAALKNVGDVPACSAAFSVELFDHSEQSLAAGIAGLLTQHFYRRTDGSGAIAACVSPEEVTMAAVTDLPAELDIAQVRSVVYRCPYFALDVVPIAGIDIRELERVKSGAGSVYTGTLKNGLDVALKNPSVTIFPTNRVGRPLGVALGSATIAVPPGGSWRFETNAVDGHAADYVAYPAGALEN